MKKTANKWDQVSAFEIKLANVLKIVSAIVFLSIWTPAFIWVMVIYRGDWIVNKETNELGYDYVQVILKA